MTTTLVVVLFTTIGLGGSTMPFMKYLESHQSGGSASSSSSSSRNRRGRRGRRRKEITLSKTRELGATIDSEHLSEMTEEELDSGGAFSIDEDGIGNGGMTLGSRRIKGFMYYDVKYLRPFLTRK